ncbi:MAG: glycoside hydrolase family 44 protein, partial [Acidimicrobiales bacterium]
VPISPEIYGLNAGVAGDFGSLPGQHVPSVLRNYGIGMARLGGDASTLFNWENNDTNVGRYSFGDYTENRNQDSVGGTPGADAQPTVSTAQSLGIPVMLTVPTGDWVAGATSSGPVNLKANPASFVANAMTGPVTDVPDPTDHVVYQNRFVDWLKVHDPQANLAFSLDNEPDLWNSTHPNVYSSNLSYRTFIDRTLGYASMIKGLIPQAKVYGPVLSDWTGQIDPEYDRNTQQFSADYNTLQAQHSGEKFLDYYLQQVHAAEVQAGKQLIDNVDLHWYPQAIQSTADMEQRPRSLWDPSYSEPTWIPGNAGGPIQLIPRLKQEIAASDPGLPGGTAPGLAISEWDYGNDQNISGTIATADTLGIFGRHGVKAAMFWPVNFYNGGENYAYAGFMAFRNYDGHGSSFGDTEVQATNTDPVNTSVYASISKANPGHLVMVAINKNTKAESATINVAGGFDTSSAAVYTLTSAGSTPVAAPGLTATARDTFTYSMPAQSVSIIVPTEAPASPAFYAQSPPSTAAQNQRYSYTFAATGTPPPTFDVATGTSTLPPGLSLDPTSGVLSGTPTTAGSFAFKVRASNTAGTATTPTLTIQVKQGLPVPLAAASAGGGGRLRD